MSARWFEELCDRYGLDPLPVCTVADLALGRVLFTTNAEPRMITELSRVGGHLTRLTLDDGTRHTRMNDERVGLIAERRHCECGRFARIDLLPSRRRCEHCTKEPANV